MQNFLALDRKGQAAAVCNMADEGFSDDVIAHASGLAIEQVRRIIGERKDSST
jgi:hypothetical protein